MYTCRGGVARLRIYRMIEEGGKRLCKPGRDHIVSLTGRADPGAQMVAIDWHHLEDPRNAEHVQGSSSSSSKTGNVSGHVH